MKKKTKRPESNHVIVVIDCCKEVAGYWCPHCNTMIFRGEVFTPQVRCDACRRPLDWSKIVR